MICPKCKNKVKDNLSMCPICGSPMKKKVRKVVKNKYIKDEASKNVGGVISNNSSVVSFKKKKVQQEIKRSDYSTYLDYQEAKDAIKDQELAKATKYKSKILKSNEPEGNGFFSILKIEKIKPNEKNIGEYKKELLESNNKTTGANKAQIKFSKNSAEASIRTKREADFNKVGNVAKTKRYSSEWKGNSSRQVSRQESYQSGRFVNVPNSSYNLNLPLEEPVKKKHGIGDFLSYMVVMAVWVIVIFVVISANNKGYYFSSGNGDMEEYTGVSKSNQVSNGSSIGVTSIVYDNQYLKQMKINNLSDVNKLIVSDSEKQKRNCPSDVKKVENEIIAHYGVTAVNFCEIDKNLAEELRNVVAYIYNEFPNARDYLTNITIANVGENETYIAAFMPVFTFATSNTSSGYPVGIKTQIILNAKYFLNPVKLKNSVSSGANSGYFPPNATSSSTVAHEFGHYLSYVAMLNYYNSNRLNYVTESDSKKLYSVYTDFTKGNFSYKLLQEAYQEYQNTTFASGTFDEFRASISRYAMAKDKSGKYIYDETIAEAFHDCYLNGEKAKPASKAILTILNQKLEEG